MSYLRRGAFWRLCDCGVGLTRYRAERTESGSQCLLFPVARLVVGTGWAASLHMASPRWRRNEGEPSGQTQRQEDLEESQMSINTKRHTDTNTHNINNKHLRKLHTQTHNNPPSFSLGTWAAILAFSAPRTAASSFNIQYMHQPHKLKARRFASDFKRHNSCRWLIIQSENHEVKDHCTINLKFPLVFFFRESASWHLSTCVHVLYKVTRPTSASERLMSLTHQCRANRSKYSEIDRGLFKNPALLILLLRNVVTCPRRTRTHGLQDLNQHVQKSIWWVWVTVKKRFLVSYLSEVRNISLICFFRSESKNESLQCMFLQTTCMLKLNIC